MTIEQRTEKALRSHDIHMISKICDYFRFKFGWNYERIQQWFENKFSIDSYTFENLMYECDELDINS